MFLLCLPPPQPPYKGIHKGGRPPPFVEAAEGRLLYMVDGEVSSIAKTRRRISNSRQAKVSTDPKPKALNVKCGTDTYLNQCVLPSTRLRRPYVTSSKIPPESPIIPIILYSFRSLTSFNQLEPLIGIGSPSRGE